MNQHANKRIVLILFLVKYSKFMNEEGKDTTVSYFHSYVLVIVNNVDLYARTRRGNRGMT